MKLTNFLFVLIILVLISASAFAAVTNPYDSFEDGDYTNNPTWATYGTGAKTATTDQAFDGTYSVYLQGNAQYAMLRYESVVQSDWDYNYGVWVRPTSTGSERNEFSMVRASDSEAVWIIYAEDGVFKYVATGGTITTIPGTAYSINNWYFMQVHKANGSTTPTYSIFDANGSLQNRIIGTVKNNYASEHLLYISRAGANIYVDYFTSEMPTIPAGVTASYDYNLNLTSGEIELTDTSTITGASVVDTWKWTVDTVQISTDQNYDYATSQNQDLNLCLQATSSGDSETDITCTNIATGKWINSLWHYTEDKANTTLKFYSDANTEGLAIATYTWIIDGNNEGATANWDKTNATQLTDYNACLYVANAIANDQNCFAIQTTDWQAPTTFATATQIPSYSTANIAITCSDNNSGCDKVYYKFNSGAWADTNTIPVDTNYLGTGTHTLYWYGKDVAGNTEDTNSLIFTITNDTTPPEIIFSTNIVTVGFVNDFNVGLSLYCTDNRLNDLNYILIKTINGVATTLLNVQDSNAQTKLYWETLGIGENYFTGRCIDYNGNTVQEISTPIYAMAFRLINEETGAALTDLNVVDVDKMQAFTYDGNNVYDYNIYASPTKYFIDYDNVVRFDLTYNDVSETKLSREIDFGLLPDTNVGLCVAPFQSFYEQFLISSTNKDVVVYNDFADCYNLASSTKFAYENALMVRAFTINKPYYLYTWIDDVKTLLATIDGSKASVINLDVLEFNNEEYTFEIATDTVVFKCLENSTTGICDQNTIGIYYRSLRGDNASIKYQVYRNNTLLWEYTESDEPNEFNTNWYYGGEDLNATDILKLVLTKTTEAGVETSADYWFDLEGQAYSGTMDASLAIIFSFMILFVGLTLVAYKYAFGWFGIALCVIAIGILSFAPGFWYVQFMQAIIVIVAVFITIVYANNVRGVN